MTNESTPQQPRSSVKKNIDDAIQRIYEYYGPNLQAFFDDVKKGRAFASKTPQQPAQGEPEDVHPCDEALGNVHQCAISLQMAGQHDTAMLLARAHQVIQNHLVAESINIDRLSAENAALESALKVYKLLFTPSEIQERVNRFNGPLPYTALAPTQQTAQPDKPASKEGVR